MNVVLLSPHPDDVAYSLGGMLANQPFPGATLISVFTQSCYTILPGPWSARHVTELRRSEDEAYARMHGLALEHVGLPDSAMLGMGDVEQLSADEQNDARRPAVRRALARILTGAEILVTPLSLGGHIDHRLVTSVVRELTCEGTINVARHLAYEDLPYASELDLPQLTRIAQRTLGPTATCKSFSIDLRAKCAAVAVYRSQLQPAEIAAFEAHGLRVAAGGCPAERLWEASA